MSKPTFISYLGPFVAFTLQTYQIQVYLKSVSVLFLLDKN